jgi:hypothetical protein
MPLSARWSQALPSRGPRIRRSQRGFPVGIITITTTEMFALNPVTRSCEGQAFWRRARLTVALCDLG